jgi:hypothetical protein
MAMRTRQSSRLRNTQTVVREQQVDVGGVDVEPDEIREGHTGLVEHGLQVVEAQRQLRPDVAVVLGLAVVAHGRLAGEVQGPSRSGHEFALVEAHVHRPRDRVDRCAFHGHSFLVNHDILCRVYR